MDLPEDGARPIAAAGGGQALQPLDGPPARGAVLLLSDLHLDRIGPAKAQHLSTVIDNDFLGASEIVLMGDLATDLHDPAVQARTQGRAAPVLAALRRQHERGTVLWTMPGNHDRALYASAGDWSALPARRLEGPPATFERFGKRLQLSHGDEHDPPRFSWLESWMRVLERRPLALAGLRALFGAEHACWRLLGRLAPVLAGRQLTAPTLRWMVDAAAHPPEMFLFAAVRWERIAEATLRAGTLDLIAMGHTHVPRLQAYEGGIYTNTGDWLEHAVVTWLDAEGVHQQDLASETSSRLVRWRDQSSATRRLS